MTGDYALSVRSCPCRMNALGLPGSELSLVPPVSWIVELNHSLF